MNEEQQLMARVFNEWARQYTDNPEAFAESLKAHTAPPEDYGERCVLTYERIKSELSAK